MNNSSEKIGKKLKLPSQQLDNKKSTFVKDSDNDLIEDALDRAGTIEKAKIHASANRILNIPKSFDRDQKVEFCDDCYLPQETKGVVEKYNYGVDPKRLAGCGYNIYLFFFFMKYLMFNLIGAFLICSVAFFYLSNRYADELFDYCTEYYKNSSSLQGFETNVTECVNFISTKEFDYTSFDWINQWSGETMLNYAKILKSIFNQKKVDDILVNFNIIPFICLLCLFICNMIFLNLSEAIVNEINFNEQSPSDYTLMISDIPTTQSDPQELKNVFLADSSAKICEINLTYKLSAMNKIKNKLRELKKIRRMNRGKEYYEVGTFLCCKSKGSMKSNDEKIRILIEELTKMEKQQNFNGVAFVTFNSETEKAKYYKEFPHSFLHKIFSNLLSGFCLYTCCCFLSEEKKRKLKRKQTIAVSIAPEPQDIIWENLEAHFTARFSRSFVGYIVSLLCIGASFGIVLGLNYLQYKSEKDFENNLILKYGISLGISAVISIINFIMSTFFKFLAKIETPWSYTEFYLSLSIKLTFFTFFNSAIVPLASNAIQYGWDSHETLVNNMLVLFLCGSVLSPLMSITCYDLLIQKFYQCLVERKYKDPQAKIDEYSQRELNAIYEGPDMGISCQYSTLSKQICMTFFYMPIFPLGAVITFVGVVLNYVVEKWKCINIYRRPEMLNQEICFFYLNYFNIAFFCFGVGNYIFFANTHSSDVYELVNIILYPVLTLLPYHKLLRACDSSGAYKNTNEITYENAYFSFPFDYERMNPVTQKQGVINYLDKLEKKGIISKQMCEKAKEKINHINVVELFYFTKQKNQFKKKDNRYQKVGYQNGQYDNYNNNNAPQNESTHLEQGIQSGNENIQGQNNYFFGGGGFVSNEQAEQINAFFANIGVLNDKEFTPIQEEGTIPPTIPFDLNQGYNPMNQMNMNQVNNYPYYQGGLLNVNMNLNMNMNNPGMINKNYNGNDYISGNYMPGY